jgi:hypothetical protein
MDVLQRAIEHSLEVVPAKFLAPVIESKLAEQGVKVTKRRSQIIAEQLLAGKKDIRIPSKTAGNVSLTLTPRDTAALLQKVEQFLETTLPQILADRLDSSAPLTLSSLKRSWRRERLLQLQEVEGFRQRLSGRWGTGISKLHMLTTIARDLGDSVNTAARSASKPAQQQVVDVVTRLHARACQVCEEIIVLLESGFADGAMARWRTMHEIAVTAAFVFDHGAECAKRYKEHEAVESYRAAKEYNELHSLLGYAPLKNSELDLINQSYEEVLRKYGKVFSGNYGWAAAALQHNHPTFKDIEKSVGTRHLRSHYRMASHGVHANPKGIYFTLTSMFPTSVILAGPSNAGLTDPGQNAAFSLVDVSATLTRLAPNFDHQLSVRVLMLLRVEIGKSLWSSDKRLRQDEKALRDQEKAEQRTQNKQ